ncbi:biopolymer transporter ExbD [Winogradskyella aurantiaca]|uniref:biopolymer transporter ExbD n=1 Tax=Winogradskyella aurantiaca TaxID=2219558 RepID=UPI000E1DFE9E|nr:biopolymer transporter ExbD [Winogradskyella aurantiaca]
MSRRNSPSVNSGSMADIAFLLLIFFLLTTTISAEKGIKRQLPLDCIGQENCSKSVAEENLFTIVTNAKSELMVNNEIMSISLLRPKLKAFIDNNSKGYCTYCSGEQSPSSSQHPTKAFVALDVHPKTKYDFYIQIQDEISGAYYELREHYAQTILNKPASDLTREEIQTTRKAYPFNLIE